MNGPWGLNEISQRKTNTVWFSVWKLKKKKKPVIDRTDWWLPEIGRDEVGEGSQKVQNSNYKIHKSWGCNV